MNFFNNALSWIANPVGSVQGQLSDIDNGTIWNHGDNYKVPSIGETANDYAGSGMDPNGIVAGLWNDITGVTAQSREFAQQEYLQDKQNEYNKPINEMRRMVEAGINPLTAASGIAGNGSPSASPSQVSTNTQGAASAVQSAAAGLQGFSQFGLNRSEIERNQSIAEKTDEEKRLLSLRFDLDKDIAIGELAMKLVGIGVPELEAAVMAFDLGSGGYKKTIEYLKGFQGLRQYSEKLSILNSEKQMKLKELDKYDEILEASISKDKQQAARDEKEAKRIEIDTWFEEEKKKIIQDIPALLFEGNNQLLYLLETYGSDSDIYKNAQKLIMDSNYSRLSGEFAARLENAFDIAFDEEKAKYQVRADYEPYFKYLDLMKEQCIELLKEFIKSPNDIKGIVGNIFGKFTGMFPWLITNQKSIESSFSRPNLPPKGHPKRKMPHPWE